MTATAQEQLAASPTPARPVVVLNKLGKTFGGAKGLNTVLEDVDLTIGQGEFVALLGASGCGKSTLLNLIAGLETPTAGSMEIPADGVAFMFQDAALFPWLTAQVNIELALKLRGVPAEERKDQSRRALGLSAFAACRCQTSTRTFWRYASTSRFGPVARPGQACTADG